MLPDSDPREPKPHRRTHRWGALAVVLVVVAACAVTLEQGKSCVCPEGTAPAPETPVEPTVTEAALAPVIPATDDVAPVEVVLPDFSDPAWTRVPSRAGKYLVCWRTSTGSVPRNADFELEVWVLQDGAPVRGAELAVSGWMPDHGHGMLRLPRTERRDDGSFHVEGMLLHMRGLWELRFDVVDGDLSESAVHALEL